MTHDSLWSEMFSLLKPKEGQFHKGMLKVLEKLEGRGDKLREKAMLF